LLYNQRNLIKVNFLRTGEYSSHEKEKYVADEGIQASKKFWCCFTALKVQKENVGS
jgi:hypothetical protein